MVDARAEQLLDAAYVCFARHGLRRTTVADIAREAGVSRPTVYQHLGTVTEALTMLTERVLGRALEDARAAAATPGALDDRVTAALGTKLDLTLTLHRDSPAHAPEILGTRHSEEVRTRYTTALREVLSDLLQDRVGAAADDVATLLLALTRGLEVADTTETGAPDPHQQLRRGVRLLLAGATRPDDRTTP